MRMHLASGAVTTHLRPKSAEDCPPGHDTEETQENREAIGSAWQTIQIPTPTLKQDQYAKQGMGRFTGHKVPPLLESSGTSTREVIETPNRPTAVRDDIKHGQSTEP